jgi:hypothetical protein
MYNTDQVVFSGDGTVTDLWSTGYKQPTTDDTQNFIPSTGILTDKVYTFSSLRALDTGDDDQDMVLNCGQ